MSKRNRDILYCIILIALSIAGIIYADVSIDQRVVEYELARPDRYVQIWLGLLCLLAILLLIRTIRRGEKTEAPKIFYGTIVVTSVLFLGFIVVMPYIGYTISAFVFLFVLTLFYNLKAMEKKPDRQEFVKLCLKILLYSVVLAIGTAFLFKNVLGVRLPDFY